MENKKEKEKKKKKKKTREATSIIQREMCTIRRPENGATNR